MKGQKVSPDLTTIDTSSAAERVRKLIRTWPWLVAVTTSAILLLALITISKTAPLDILLSNIYLASFVAIAALGQMFVVATGRGAIDLSIPYTITLCVYIATIVQDGSDMNLATSIGATVLVGMLVGVVNGFAVVVLRIPAMVATLAVGFIAQSVVQVISSTGGHAGSSPMIGILARQSILGIPFFAIVAVIVAIIVAVVVHRSGYGMQLLATGQNDVAAILAGLEPGRVRWIAFILSGALAGITAVLLGGYSGGASLGVGASFLISTIAAVVLGGTLMSGGFVSVAGVLGGALFLTLLVTLTNSLNMPPGTRMVIEGLVILTALGIGARRQR